MAIDVKREIATVAPPKRHWWQRVFITRDVPLRARGYWMSGQDFRLDTNRPTAGNDIGIPADASVIVLTAETATVRYIVGEMPVTSYGNPLPAGSSIVLTLTDPDSLNVVAGGAGAVLHIQAYRPGGQ